MGTRMTQNVPTAMTIARMIATTDWATICAPTRQRGQPPCATSDVSKNKTCTNSSEVGGAAGDTAQVQAHRAAGAVRDRDGDHRSDVSRGDFPPCRSTSERRLMGFDKQDR
jgi:hypothetical protein